MKTALLSAYTKNEELADFAKALREREWDILASAGTKKFLTEQGVESIDVATIAGEPILGHRVVTLSREIHAGLLARNEDEPELKRLHIRRIDLVLCDLYPLEEEIARPGATEETVIEKTDIGGPAMLRSGAKGRRIVISSREQIPEVLAYLDSNLEDKKFLTRLAGEAEKLVALYVTASAAYTLRASNS